jgi:hypothetical protein
MTNKELEQLGMAIGNAGGAASSIGCALVIICGFLFLLLACVMSK